MSGPLVIKVGGSTLGDADTSLADIAALAGTGDVPIVVHGGGAEATSWLERMAIVSEFRRGRRVTDERTLPIVVAVYGGLVNKRIVGAISSAGAQACGLSGADASLIECEITDPDFGFVGEPRSVNTAAVDALLEAGIIPVIACLGFVDRDGRRQIVNVNADLIAGRVAAAVGARELLFLTDVDGVRDAAGTVVKSLTEAKAREMLEDGTISSGMVPKVEACLTAASLGVPVRILDGRRPGAIPDRAGRGTAIVP